MYTFIYLLESLFTSLKYLFNEFDYLDFKSEHLNCLGFWSHCYKKN